MKGLPLRLLNPGGRGRGLHAGTLTRADAEEMRRLAKEGVSRTDLAMRFGVTHSHVCSVLAGRAWSRPPRPTTADRIQRLSIPEPNTGCWLWLGTMTDDGYGRMMMGGRDGQTVGAHRVAYETFVGPIPDGLHIDHLCRVRCCVNPAHLEAVTPRINALRGVSMVAVHAKKTHCKRGHPFDATNTLIRPCDGGRHCRACARLREIAKQDRATAEREAAREVLADSPRRVVAVVGSRNFRNLDAVRQFVRGLPADAVVVSGGARGVDSAAEQEAQVRALEVVSIRPDYASHGNRAPLVRNREIAERCTEMVAFWDGKSTGTQHVVGCAQKLAKPVKVVTQ